MVQNGPKRAIHDEAWNGSMEEKDRPMGNTNTNSKEWRDNLKDEVEGGLITGPDKEKVAGYENMNVAGYEKLMEKEACQ